MKSNTASTIGLFEDLENAVYTKVRNKKGWLDFL